ncbi:MAG: lysine--tRNA ligase [Phycisphaerales bacterium]
MTTSSVPDSVHPLEAQRRANRAAAAALGLRPYGTREDGLDSLAAAKGKYNEAADRAHQAADAAAKAAKKEAGAEGAVGAASRSPDARPSVKVAGRVVLLRDNGKLLWLTLRDSTGDLQVAASQRDVDEAGFKFAKTVDLGDVIVAEGCLMKTKTGETTVWCSGLRPAAKCLATPPEKHAGLSDVELRYRQRYVDLWVNPETARVFELRSRIISRMRAFLDGRGYVEVETPMLQLLAGGAAARPFATHMNALGLPLFLRIAPELYLKRLLVGGMPRVYEINRNFRNEGLDKQHNPEFTMLEAYHAFGDFETVMEMTESLVRDAARAVAGGGSVALSFGDLTIDYAKPFARVRYGDLFEKALGFAMTDSARVRKECEARHIKTKAANGSPVADVLLINELFEHAAEPTVDPSVPTFITHYPAAISPLTRPNVEDPTLADRADLFIGGMEVAPHYTELNDPDVQAAKFREQLAGADTEKSAEEATFRTFDADFINALKVGMPPAGGMGLGIDRLVMLLTNQRTIRDAVMFPLMKPVE